MRILAMYAACALVGFSSLALAQGKGPADRPASGECLCIIPANVQIPAGAGQSRGLGNASGDRVALGRDGQVVVLPGPACRALRDKFECEDVEIPVSP